MGAGGIVIGISGVSKQVQRLIKLRIYIHICAVQDEEGV